MYYMQVIVNAAARTIHNTFGSLNKGSLDSVRLTLITWTHVSYIIKDIMEHTRTKK